jgi:hypothetical protein
VAIRKKQIGGKANRIGNVCVLNIYSDKSKWLVVIMNHNEVKLIGQQLRIKAHMTLT